VIVDLANGRSLLLSRFVRVHAFCDIPVYNLKTHAVVGHLMLILRVLRLNMEVFCFVHRVQICLHREPRAACGVALAVSTACCRPSAA